MIRRGIVLAGTAILDIVNIVDHWPAEETVSLIQHTEHAPGGPPYNAAAGLMKLGATFPVSLIGVVGDDAHGVIFLDKASATGLDVAGLKMLPGAVTSYTHVMTTAASGRRTFFHQVGVSERLEVQDLMPNTSSARLFYVGSPGIARKLDEGDGWRQLLASARKQGMKTCLELVPIGSDVIHRYVPSILALCDYVVVNDFEARSITQLPTVNGERLDFAAARSACQRMRAMGVGEVAAIHHPDGAVAASRTGEVVMAGSVKVPAGEIAGTVGAGDAFYSGMLFGFHEGWSLRECIRLGNAAAATSLHAPTTCASIRPWQDCLSYAEEMGVRAINTG
ncbi:MAG: carbohydrate kinase family protein [Rhizobiales bacterium]|nr:carbohydrate kinase family protein [Hyphomicrobiales bacterium]